VVGWESQFWQRRLHGQLYRAGIDTTFAMYRPGGWPGIWPSIRSGRPYLARHMPWYADSSMPTAEEEYYATNSMPGVTNWAADEPVNEYHQNPPKPMNVKDRIRWRLHVLRVHGLSPKLPD
jgi:hypothetical protein